MTLLLEAGKPRRVPKYRLIQSDVLDFCAQYRGPKFPALLCDPPYHLTTITERFGGKDAAPAKFGKDGAFARASKGFMNQQWDGGDIAFRPETWAAFGSIMLDGAFGMAFASTRGYHRMVCAIEDAGFIIHPMIGWLFGSGFPKATQVKDERFEGHRYGLQALKPALEPVCVFQKPYVGRTRDCITAAGAGTLNIDAGRVATDDNLGGGGYQTPMPAGWDRPYRNDESRRELYEDRAKQKIAHAEDLGRWPANLALVHSADCTPHVCAGDCPILHMGAQSGERSAGGNIVDAQSEPFANIYSGRFNRQRDYEGFGDTGTAARFFYNTDWSLDVEMKIADADPFLYMAKASTEERNRGLEDFAYQTVNDGREKSIDNAYQRGETKRQNPHPSVKPIGITRWLASLLLPPADYAPRRIFVPFSGSGSEMIGAHLAGWETVCGVEMGHEYIDVARARLDYYTDPLREMRKAASYQTDLMEALS